MSESSQRSVFRWNAGGWFGGQIGATCWMLISGFVLLPRSVPAAVGALAAFAVSNAFGTWLWMRRGRIAAYRAVQLLLVVAALASFAGVYCLDQGGVLEERWAGGPMPASRAYAAVAIAFAVVMISVFMKERAQRRAADITDDPGARSR